MKMVAHSEITEGEIVLRFLRFPTVNPLLIELCCNCGVSTVSHQKSTFRWDLLCTVQLPLLLHPSVHVSVSFHPTGSEANAKAYRQHRWADCCEALPFGTVQPAATVYLH